MTVSHLLDFADLAHRFARLTPGQQAELRRIGDPAEASLKPAFYRLFPGHRATEQLERLAFLLPWAEHRAGAAALGQQLARSGKVSETRIFQMARSNSPNDLKHLRRLVQHLRPMLDWNQFGKTLWYWGPKAKRGLLEEFFAHQPPSQRSIDTHFAETNT
jgi:CRISPR system Cascade subunit CasB